MTSTDQQNGPLLHLENISKIYHMGEVDVHALREVDLQVADGEFTAIMGSSGSGKTTMLNVLGCLDLPTTGTYRLNGRDVTTMSDRQISRLRGEGIGFVFQNYSLLSRFSALHNVEMPRYYRDRRGDHSRALELLTLVSLEDRAHHKPTELSGGQQQRVAVARALMNDPFLLLADEPTGNLDSQSGDTLMDLLDRLNREQGLTIIMVTHDAAIGERARRVVRMQDGRIVDDETRS